MLNKKINITPLPSCNYLTVTDRYETSLRCFNFTLGEINLNFVIFNFNSKEKTLKIHDTRLTERVDLPTNRTGKADGAEQRKCKRRSKSESGTHQRGALARLGQLTTAKNFTKIY